MMPPVLEFASTESMAERMSSFWRCEIRSRRARARARDGAPDARPRNVRAAPAPQARTSPPRKSGSGRGCSRAYRSRTPRRPPACPRATALSARPSGPALSRRTGPSSASGRTHRPSLVDRPWRTTRPRSRGTGPLCCGSWRVKTRVPDRLGPSADADRSTRRGKCGSHRRGRVGRLIGFVELHRMPDDKKRAHTSCLRLAGCPSVAQSPLRENIHTSLYSSGKR